MLWTYALYNWTNLLNDVISNKILFSLISIYTTLLRNTSLTLNSSLGWFYRCLSTRVIILSEWFFLVRYIGQEDVIEVRTMFRNCDHFWNRRRSVSDRLGAQIPRILFIATERGLFLARSIHWLWFNILFIERKTRLSRRRLGNHGVDGRACTLYVEEL